ncbi:hypothetical protein [Bacteroides fragilis]|jgi:hypothetical protein|uniref:hypothetical protein n=1 Tax=Bacteroides fragilis TaxID=817 RepID=UPI00202F2C3D|nr:hypothetical protein [Bacteroides fragilis]MCM0248831.1 hypothetical protein [Bacteroides fragilis]MCM0257351.1 hypothetical protein [Bacteroides fragilis]
MMKINGKLVGNFLTEGMITALPDWFVVLGSSGSNGKNQRMVEALSIDDELNAYWG